ncbi:hypothetical protein M1E17_01535 [Arthrobacter sp. D1-29]
MSAERMFHDMRDCPDPWLDEDIPADVRQFAIESLRWQAQEIIDEVLRGSDPREELARARLRRCVNQNPGKPELALLQQLTFNRDLPD